MNIIPFNNSKPSRSMIGRLIHEGAQRHHIRWSMTSTQLARAIGEADHDELVELAFFAMSDIGDEQAHHEIFIERCKMLGLE